MTSVEDRHVVPAARPLRVACIGAGPGGLFTAIALSKALPNTSIDVFERSDESDVFGFGVVFSDATLGNVDRVDPVLRETLDAHGRHWDTVTVRTASATMSAGGNGMSAVHRRVLLDALRERARECGARLHFATEVTVDDLDVHDHYDLIVAADGTNSATRQRFLPDLGHTVNEARVKFIWFGTTFQFDGLTFLHSQSEHGSFAVHGYPIGSGLSTFIVETDESTWRNAGLDAFDMTTPPGVSDLVTQRYLEVLYADQIDGHKLVSNNSRWANFRTRRTRHWNTRTDTGTPVVFLGDAVHTAHFSVGSGTKMAMEDAAVLAQTIAEHHGDLPAALARFERIRRPEVAKIQDSALPSLSWWDHFGDYCGALEPWQFGFHFFSRAISAEKIRARDPLFVSETEQRWRAKYGAAPLDTPLQAGPLRLNHRLLQLTEHSPSRVQLTDGLTALCAGDDGALPLVTAPDTDGTSLAPTVRAALDHICTQRPAAVVVRGGTALARVLCSEHVRLNHRIPTIVIDQAAAIRSRRAVDDRDCASTLVLSGRADAVAFEADPTTTKGVVAHAEAAR
ncbi:tryptophan hydroxylase vioD [Mycobacteroides abscessus subsp. bolletii]|uniref:FAD-dependent monooxygenase n=1 Tax=Mycobacteroides abscessus TaxID=36809 RepID=UPI0009CFD461|nr:FAD-dependent monooxygenase [Mycobacteroides abscessus]SKG70219.1 tryptophan hydroxylase vioD [Mycobacteroides abscessus subsp. bolletii]SKH12181.1 tryptophan hydroxylase vioD [Mycobacteroides abscessus subsp. bolletii]